MSRLVRSVSSSWTAVAGSQGNWAEFGSAAASPSWSRCRGADASLAAVDGAAKVAIVTSTMVAGDTEDESNTVELAPDTKNDLSEASPQPTSAVAPSTMRIVVILVRRREKCCCMLRSSTVRLGIIVLRTTRTPRQAPGSPSDFDSSVLPDPTCGTEPDGIPCGDTRNTTTIDTTNPMSSRPSGSGTQGRSVTSDDAHRISAGGSSSSRGGGAGGRRQRRSRCCPSLRTRPPMEIRR